MTQRLRRKIDRISAGMRRSAGSLRTQLIFWNVAALLLLLGGLGIACRYITLTFMMQSVDRELDQSIAMYRRPPPPDRGRFPGGGPPGPFGPGGNEPWNDSGVPGQPGESGPQGGPGGMPPPPEPPDHDTPFRRRLFTPEGKPALPGNDSPAWDDAALALALKGKVVHTTIRVDGEPVRILSAPAYSREGVLGAVQNAYPLKNVYRAIAGIDAGLLLLVPIGLLGAGWMGTTLTSRVLRRVHRMTVAAAGIGAEDLTQRLPTAGNDEFAELAQTFNGLLARLDRAFQEQNRLLDQQRRFTADASHELKTPLTIIKGSASLSLASAATDEVSRQTFQEIDAAANAMSQLVQDLLLLARADEGQLGRDRIDILVRDLLESARSRASRNGKAPIALRVDPEDLVVTGNESELVRLFSNLMDNAVYYTPADGHVTVLADCCSDSVIVTVEDTGSGIAPEHLPHLGERFYRADASRTRPTGGTGLGLSICKSIVKAHGGTITFNSELGVGTRAIVILLRHPRV